jgi:hypothetical protein
MISYFKKIYYKQAFNSDFFGILVNPFYFARRNKLIRLIGMLFFMAPINVLGLILSKFLLKNPGLYLDQLVLAEKIS